ncbi:MAG: hypothetical protein U0M12_04045 [Acutalibacteraceae bacterium]|nr:hypothetical protein [Acutalibacteraceae bacterium]
MIFKFTKTDGSEEIKTSPTYVSINCLLSAPADSMTAVFKYSGKYTDYKLVKVIFDERVIFTGVVDSQKITVNSKGEYLTVSCRSMAGCLLDNQLQPQNIQNITDSVIYERYLKPYGIGINTVTNKPCISVINIGKGVSVYELLSEYSYRVFACEPRIDIFGKAILNGDINSVNYHFTNGANAMDKNSFYCTSIEVENSRYGVISAVYVRNSLNETGYSLKIENENAINRGIEAVRYLDATPTSGYCTYDATRMIKNSNKQSKTIKVVCPCFVYNALGGNASVDIEGLLCKNLKINSVSYVFDKSGVVTTINMNEKGE